MSASSTASSLAPSRSTSLNELQHESHSTVAQPGITVAAAADASQQMSGASFIEQPQSYTSPSELTPLNPAFHRSISMELPSRQPIGSQTTDGPLNQVLQQRAIAPGILVTPHAGIIGYAGLPVAVPVSSATLPTAADLLRPPSNASAPPAASSNAHSMPSISASPTPAHQQASLPPPPKQPYHLMDDLAGMRSGELTNALIHLYRGEMGRQAQYRLRLDTSTNWSITVAAGMTVFSLGNDTIPHYFFGVILIFLCVFLLFEARRYGYYMAVKQRVRQLECGFFGRVLLGSDFGKSMCGLLPVEQPPPGVVQPDASPQPLVSPKFVSPWTKPRTLDTHAPSTSTASTATNSPLSQRPDGNSAAPGGAGIEMTSNASADPSAQPTQQHPSAPAPIQPFFNDWTYLLYHSLLYPEVNISLFDSILIRLRRVYLMLLLGVLASWIIKVQLDIGLSAHWLMVSIVSLIYAVAFVVVVYYLPRQRSRMHREKHVAAMFINEQQEQAKVQAKTMQADANQRSTWWRAGHPGEAAAAHMNDGMRQRRQAPQPFQRPSDASSSMGPYNGISFGAPSSANLDINSFTYWKKHMARRNIEEADL
jgi:uncharacterized membrane protein